MSLKKILSTAFLFVVVIFSSRAQAVTTNSVESGYETDFCEIQFNEWIATDDSNVVSPWRANPDFQAIDCGKFNFVEFYEDAITTANLRFLRRDETVMVSMDIQRGVVYPTRGFSYVDIKMFSWGVSTNVKGSVRFYKNIPASYSGDLTAGEPLALNVSGSFTLNSASTTNLFVHEGVSGTDLDQVTVTSGINLVTANIGTIEGTIYNLDISNANASFRYARLYNDVDANDETKFLKQWPIPGNGSMLVLNRWDLGPNGLHYGTALTLAISTVNTGFTAATDTEHYFQAGFK